MSIQKTIVDTLSKLTETGLVIKSVNWQTGEIVCNVISRESASVNSSQTIDHRNDPRIIGPTRQHGFAQPAETIDSTWQVTSGPLSLREYLICSNERNSKIDAIKLVREQRGISLGDAKRLVEANYDFPIPAY